MSDRRPQLFAKLKQMMALCRASGIIVRLLVAGSFVTSKPDPNDIDLILVLSNDVDFDNGRVGIVEVELYGDS